jgi:hypothetical protein
MKNVSRKDAKKNAKTQTKQGFDFAALLLSLRLGVKLH